MLFRSIARLNAVEHQAAVFYIHPWEIDPEQPRLQAGWLGRFRHYRNLDKTEDRLRALLTDFRFGTVAALLRVCEPAAPPEQPLTLALPYQW